MIHLINEYFRKRHLEIEQARRWLDVSRGAVPGYPKECGPELNTFFSQGDSMHNTIGNHPAFTAPNATIDTIETAKIREASVIGRTLNQTKLSHSEEQFVYDALKEVVSALLFRGRNVHDSVYAVRDAAQNFPHIVNLVVNDLVTKSKEKSND